MIQHTPYKMLSFESLTFAGEEFMLLSLVIYIAILLPTRTALSQCMLGIPHVLCRA